MSVEEVYYFLLFAYFIPFAAFTTVVYAVKGSKALQWHVGVRKSALCNIAFLAANLAFAPVAFAVTNLAQSAYEAFNIPHVSSDVWQQTPVWAVAFFYLIAYDFADYWNHRLLHSRGFWPIHAVHHSDPDMNFTTSHRVHLFEPVVMGLSYILLLSWLGMPAETSVLLVMAITFYNKFVHIDADIHFGPLNKVFATPRFHRWHHAFDKAAYDTNFANIFSLWDVMFGTYRVPGAYNGPLGFEDSPNHDFVSLMAFPLVAWGRSMQKVRRQSKPSERTPPATA